MPLLSAWQICVWAFKRHPNQRVKDSASSVEWQFYAESHPMKTRSKSLNGIRTNEKKIPHQARNDSSYIVFLLFIKCGMTIHNHFACPRGIFIKNSLGIIPKERQRNDEESHTMFTNLPHQCFWKSSTRCSGWDASFIGMTYCPACHSDRATKERRGIPHHAHVNLLKNVDGKAVRNAPDGMPFSSAWQSVFGFLRGIRTNE